MKISADTKSPHWKPYAKNFNVFLDGIKQSLVTEADTIEGYIDQVQINKKGNLITKDGNICIKRTEGLVELRFA